MCPRSAAVPAAAGPSAPAASASAPPCPAVEAGRRRCAGSATAGWRGKALHRYDYKPCRRGAAVLWGVQSQDVYHGLRGCALWCQRSLKELRLSLHGWTQDIYRCPSQRRPGYAPPCVCSPFWKCSLSRSVAVQQPNDVIKVLPLSKQHLSYSFLRGLYYVWPENLNFET